MLNIQVLKTFKYIIFDLIKFLALKNACNIFNKIMLQEIEQKIQNYNSINKLFQKK